MQEMNGCRVLPQNQGGAFLFPSFFHSPPFKIAIVAGGVMDPLPLRAGMDLQAHKAFAQIEFIQIQLERASIECWVIGSRRQSWLPFLFAGTLPVLECGEISSGFPNAIFDDRAAIAVGKSGKRLTEVPGRERIRMGVRFDGLQLRPG